MSLSKREIILAIKLVLIAVVTVGAPIVAGAWVDDYTQQSQQQFIAMTQQSGELDRQMQAAAAQQQLLQTHLGDYENWVAQGALVSSAASTATAAATVDEWLRIIRAALTAQSASALQYEVADDEQEVAAAALIGDEADISIRARELRLSMPMRHDLEMFALLNRIKALAPTARFFYPRRCEITRVAPGFDPARATNLTAACALTLITPADPHLQPPE